MRRYRLAEQILSLVAPSDRVASAVGDLMEETSERGRFWFWRSVTRLWLSWLGRDLVAAPVAKVGCSVIGWFLYIWLSAALALMGYIAVTLLWGAAYVLAHHTGFELLADALRIRFDWPPIPASATWAIQVSVLFAIAPFALGRANARSWRGHELSMTIVMLLMWTAMARLIPIVGVGVRASPVMMPVAVMFVLAGALTTRFNSLPRRA